MNTKTSLFIILFFVGLLPHAHAQTAMELIWSDEFDQGGMPDTSKWAYDVGGHGWGNQELQYYTQADPGNVQIKGGYLTITARQEKRGDNPYTSAKLVTRGKADWQYGRIVVSARLPEGKGTWPAIWMLPAVEELNWPKDGEIDIMEHVGYEPGVVHGTVHTDAYNHTKGTQVGQQVEIPDYNEVFHEYAVEWAPDQIRWYVDGEQYHSFDNEGNQAAWPFDKPFYLILNVAVGGEWGGKKGIDGNIWPQSLEVDYVRVYKMEE